MQKSYWWPSVLSQAQGCRDTSKEAGMAWVLAVEDQQSHADPELTIPAHQGYSVQAHSATTELVWSLLLSLLSCRALQGTSTEHLQWLLLPEWQVFVDP